MRINTDADVIIVGAGIAGMMAAHTLLEREPSLNILILEASDGVGGRATTVPLLTEGAKEVLSYDIGGEWVTRKQTELMNLIEELDIKLITNNSEGNIIVDNEYIYSAENRLDILKFLNADEKMQYLKFICKVNEFCKKFASQPKIDMVSQLSNLTLEEFIKRHVESPEVRNVIIHMITNFCGERASKISALFYLFFCMSTKGIQNQLITTNTLFEYRLKGGAKVICEKIAAQIGRLYISKNEPVWKIKRNKDHIKVTAEDDDYTCTQVIVAVPPQAILDMTIIPNLPDEKIDALRNISSGTITKFVVTYNTAFWKEQNFSGEIYVFNKNHTNGPIHFCYDASTPRKPALSGRIIGGRETFNNTFLYKEAVLQQLSIYFGKEALTPVQYYEKVWLASIYESGPMACWNVGNINFMHTIKISHAGIHWAGAESSSEWYGFMAGAVLSGKRAALEVLYDLRPSVLSVEDMVLLYPSVKRNSLVKDLNLEPIGCEYALINWKTILIPLCVIFLIAIWNYRKRQIYKALK